MEQQGNNNRTKVLLFWKAWSEREIYFVQDLLNKEGKNSQWFKGFNNDKFGLFALISDDCL